MKNFDPPLDVGIEKAVNILFDAGIETYKSCEGGDSRSHAFPEPIIRFHGDRFEGFKAFAIAMQNNLRVTDLRRIYDVLDGELVGPYWEMVFSKQL